MLQVEGDGGFLQNIQELAVARKNLQNLGIYLWVNNGYASIRMTQKTYFNGAWLGCDTESGLGFPAWDSLITSFGIPCLEMGPEGFASPDLQAFIQAMASMRCWCRSILLRPSCRRSPPSSLQAGGCSPILFIGLDHPFPRICIDRLPHTSPPQNPPHESNRKKAI